MTRLQEAVILGLTLGVFHGMMQPARSVPVVPNFTQGLDDYHTETTSKVTETINSIDYATGWQYSVTGTNVSNNGAFATSSHDHKHSGCKSNGRNRRSSHKFSNWSRLKQCQLHDHKSGSGISVHDNVSRTRNHKSNCDSKSYRRYFNHRYNKCLYAVAALFLTTPSYANVGGVSATANPIANETRPVTNQAHSGFARSLHHQHVWKRDPVSRSHNELHTLCHTLHQ